MKELQVIQNQCIKALFCLPRGTSTTYLNGSTVLPVKEMGLVKHNFNFVLNVEVYGRLTRRMSNIFVFNPSNSSNNSTSAKIFEYNQLDDELRHLNCIKTFHIHYLCKNEPNCVLLELHAGLLLLQKYLKLCKKYRSIYVLTLDEIFESSNSLDCSNEN